MIPGQYRVRDGSIELNRGRETVDVTVINMGDRPIQVGSHYHFFEVNRALAFERGLAYGMRLHIPAGTAVRFEPGEEKDVTLVELGGIRLAYGLNSLAQGPAVRGAMPDRVRERLERWERGVVGPAMPQESQESGIRRGFPSESLESGIRSGIPAESQGSNLRSGIPSESLEEEQP